MPPVSMPLPRFTPPGLVGPPAIVPSVMPRVPPLFASDGRQLQQENATLSSAIANLAMQVQRLAEENQ